MGLIIPSKEEQDLIDAFEFWKANLQNYGSMTNVLKRFKAEQDNKIREIELNIRSK